MGTRCGDIDPTCIEYIANKEHMDLEQVMEVVNKKSGVLGISGVSSDFRDIEQAAKEGNKRAQLALDTYKHTLLKFIGSYVAVLGGVDTIVFTAGLGENDPSIRKSICENLKFLGITVDDEKNNTHGEEVKISTDDSNVDVYVIPTNEELAICRDTVDIVTKKYVEDAVNKVLG